MKKLLIAVGLSMAMAAGAQAADKVAMVNLSNLFQQVVKDSGTDKVLDNEFKGRASELRKMEEDLNAKLGKLQKEGQKMKAADRGKLEKEITDGRDKFAGKARQLEQDHQRRTEEERGKILNRIDVALKKVAADQKIDVVLNSEVVLYNGSSVKDISADVLKQVK